MNPFKALAQEILSRADVKINGTRPWDIQIQDERFYRKALLQGSLGLGESYVEGWWTCADLEGLVYRLIGSGVERKAMLLPGFIAFDGIAKLVDRQTRTKCMHVIERHYNMGNDLFSEFLGQHKNYSCGYFKNTDNLDIAQRQKMKLVCEKLNLSPGDHVLDVGGGWGELARYAAQSHGCHVTSINISDEQLRFAREYCQGATVDVVKCDYRDVKGRFDKIAVVAMLTHVGCKNYRRFMQLMHGCLKPGGIMLIESVGGNASLTHCEPWTDKYIFPGGMIPSLAQIGRAIENLFVLEDLHNFGPSYVQTLRAWNRNLHRAWPRLRQRYGEHTRRMFEYFFLVVAGAFRARDLQHWQLVLTKPGTPQPACRLS